MSFRTRSVDLKIINVRIGQQIKSERLSCGARVSGIARLLGITEEDYLDIESGGANVQAAQMTLIAARLHVPISALFKEIDVAVEPRGER